mgnify:CR=1 FL=1
MAELSARLIAKASGTAGETPDVNDLEVAELALNTADGKLFTKHTDNTIKEISGTGQTINKAALKAAVAASTDFADFQTRIAAL